MSTPADRTATRRTNPIDQRQRIGELLADLPPHANSNVAELWPRLVHQLARRGQLSSPSFERAL